MLPTVIEGYRAGARGVITTDITTSGGAGSESKVEVDLKPSFYEIISNDEDILKILVVVMNGMSTCASSLQKQLTEWDRFQHLYTVSGGLFIATAL